MTFELREVTTPEEAEILIGSKIEEMTKDIMVEVPLPFLQNLLAAVSMKPTPVEVVEVPVPAAEPNYLECRACGHRGVIDLPTNLCHTCLTERPILRECRRCSEFEVLDPDSFLCAKCLSERNQQAELEPTPEELAIFTDTAAPPPAPKPEIPEGETEEGWQAKVEASKKIDQSLNGHAKQAAPAVAEPAPIVVEELKPDPDAPVADGHLQAMVNTFDPGNGFTLRLDQAIQLTLLLAISTPDSKIMLNMGIDLNSLRNHRSVLNKYAIQYAQLVRPAAKEKYLELLRAKMLKEGVKE